ncbi:MAG TPA: MerR family transcriptional regulator [Gaiellaceae bacterium]|nr:MerR family transcriptional regulator [Gaiellaceae bacterium]
MRTEGYLRIGELSRRTGVSVELLRLGKALPLLDPSRSGGGFRLYSDADVARVEAMQQHLGAGVAAAEAARRTLRSAVPERSGGVSSRRRTSSRKPSRGSTMPPRTPCSTACWGR